MLVLIKRLCWYAIALISTGACTETKKASMSTLRLPPPGITINVQDHLDIKHVAGNVDGVVNYQTLLLEGPTTVFSCDSDVSKSEHTVAILDHRSIPPPEIYNGPSSDSSDTGGPLPQYLPGTIARGYDMAKALPMLDNFVIEGSCNDWKIDLKFSILTDGTMSVSKAIERRRQ